MYEIFQIAEANRTENEITQIHGESFYNDSTAAAARNYETKVKKNTKKKTIQNA